MMAVRRWTSILCLAVLATTLQAQTTTTTQARTTQPVAADTDKDLTNPTAFKLSMTDTLRIAMERNLGITLQNYDYRMASESLRSLYGLYDWFGSANLRRESRFVQNDERFGAA